jgi:hypothetical protein
MRGNSLFPFFKSTIYLNNISLFYCFFLVFLFFLIYYSIGLLILVSWFKLRVWPVNSDFLSFLVESPLQFYLSIFGWFGTRLHNYFLFDFYDVILVSLSRSRVWQVNSGWISYFFCLLFNNFFLFHPLTLDWFGDELHNFFICFLWSYLGHMKRVASLAC